MLLKELLRDLRNAGTRDVPTLRLVRQKWSKRLGAASPQEVMRAAREVLTRGEPEFRFVAYELIYFNEPTRASLSKSDIEALAHGMDTWDAVDAFTYFISGPAWRDGQISDATIAKWASSKNRWWRRAALTSSIWLSRRNSVEERDIERALDVCASLAADRDDMVVKAMSWALREVAKHDSAAATRFIAEHSEALAPRVLREVRNKLATGLKNPRNRSCSC